MTGGLQLVVGVPYLFASILAPRGVVMVLWATWCAVTVVLVARWARGASRSLFLFPLATLLLWFVVLAAAPLVIGRWDA